MKKILFLFSIFLVMLGVNSVAFAASDPKNPLSHHDELKVGNQFLMLKSDTVDFNGMDYSVYKEECNGEDYVKSDETGVKYAKKGNGEFIQHKDGEYSPVTHNGIERSNYSMIPVGWSYTCEEYIWDDDEEDYIYCHRYGTTWDETRYKAYTKEVFENTIAPYHDSSWCEHAAAAYESFIHGYENEKIRSSQSSKVEYYVYGGMPVGIPAFTLLTSIAPNNDLWVDIYTADAKKGIYNAGVFQLFDSTSPHIKHTASNITAEEKVLKHTVQVFTDVASKSLSGSMYYPKAVVAGDTLQYFIACNECSTCERCETSNYGKFNTYVSYGEIPEFYLSRGCQLHSCCFVHDYPVVLPDEFEGIKCPELKIEGDAFPACEAHTCKRWLEHSDYRRTFHPQSCLKVVAGTMMAGTESGGKEVRYNGPVDTGVIEAGGLEIVNGGYSEYCANHMCNAFFCDNPREDSESYAVKYSKTKNEVSMANKYCSDHKLGCKVVCNYSLQPTEKVGGIGETIVEQVRKDQKQGKFSFCGQTVTQSFYSYNQPDAMICEGCYGLMGKGKLNSSSGKKSLDVVSKCPHCGSSGISVFATLTGSKWCAPCIDLKQYGVLHRNMDNYNYTMVKGYRRDNTCIYNLQRFAGDNPSLCGEKCVEERYYCYWHLCDTEDCANPVKYNGTYFCKECCPDP